MAAPRIFVGEDVLVEPVPVEIVVGIARIAFLPLVGNHAGIDAAALVEVEIGVDVGGESEPLGQPDLETLVEIDLVVLGAVGGVLDLCERTFLPLEDARERPVGIIEVEIGTARKHGRHELALVDAVLLRIAQRDAAVEREPAVGVVIGVETGREALEPGVGHDTALVVIARGAVVLDFVGTARDAEVDLVFLAPLEQDVLVVVVDVERRVERILDNHEALVGRTDFVLKEERPALEVVVAAVGAGGLRELVGELAPRMVVLDLDARRGDRTALGGDDEDAVGRTRTVHGGRCGILEHLDREDVGSVDAVDVLHGDAVDDEQGLDSLGRESGDTAHVDRSGLAGLARTGRDVDAGDLSLHGLEDVGSHLALDGLLRKGGDGARDVALLHRAVSDDHHFVDLLGVGHQVDAQAVGLRAQGAGLVADERHLHLGAPPRKAERESAAGTCHGTVGSAGLGDRSAYKRLTVGVDLAGEGKIPPPGILRRNKPRRQQHEPREEQPLRMELRQKFLHKGLY